MSALFLDEKDPKVRLEKLLQNSRQVVQELRTEENLRLINQLNYLSRALEDASQLAGELQATREGGGS